MTKTTSMYSINAKGRGKELLKRYALPAVAILLAFIVSGCTIFGKPVFYRPMVTGFYLASTGPDNPLPDLKNHAGDMDYFSPLWYHANVDGTLSVDVQPEALAVAQKNKLKITPLINLATNRDNILVDHTAQTNAINNIARVVKDNNYDGVNIDFEFIPSGGKDFSYDRNLLTAFMKDLHNKLNSMGKEVDMSVLPHYKVSPSLSSIYDYGDLAHYVNHVTIMTYDHSSADSPPGPVAPFYWVEQNIKTAINQGFKPSQICLGVASYGYDWPVGQSGGFSKPTTDIMQTADKYGAQVKWDDQYQEPYYVYTDESGDTREVWFENHATLLTKINLVKKYRLFGICIWRLGYTDQNFWSVIEKNIGK